MINRRSLPASLGKVMEVSGARPARERLGFSLSIFFVWLWFEFGRPANPLSIPMVLSILLLGGWLARKDKRWSRQGSWFVALLVVMAAGGPLAVNSFSALWATYGMAVLLICICIPMQSLITSVWKVKMWIYAFLGVALYVGVWALFHGGYGPSGAAGGQDENYVASMMAMAIPFAYFSIFTEKRRLAKALLAFSILVFCGAIVVGQDLSRGGVLGVGAVFLYCLARSPKKFVGSIILVVLIGVATMFTGSAFWQDMETIGDVEEGTADMRIEIWKIGMRMWRANPVLGVGAGNFRWQVGEYESTEQREKYGRDLGGSIIAHSLFVELLAELGTIGAIVVAGLLWHTWRDLRKVQRGAIGEAGRQRADGDLVTLRCYADAVTASILACLVTGVFLSLLYFSYLWLLTALAGAVAHVFRSQIKAQETAA